jgi:hypothetical protein
MGSRASVRLILPSCRLRPFLYAPLRYRGPSPSGLERRFLLKLGREQPGQTWVAGSLLTGTDAEKVRELLDREFMTSAIARFQAMRAGCGRSAFGHTSSPLKANPYSIVMKKAGCPAARPHGF